ncbi:hypothetical protein ISS42_00470 [Candidatus Shapirobacteria bacterium]|nr:hypothetical protein [Candidatus Shapirobacteria bacterium]
MSDFKVLAWLDCPFERTNDPYPGLCDLYLDTNQNQICDHSEAGSSSVFWWLFLPAAAYFIYWYLVNKTSLRRKRGFLSLVGFKYFWNLVLLLLFIPAGLFGLLWALGVKTELILSWHNNLGIVFVVISLLHIFGHLAYFLKTWRIFRK